MSAQTTIAQGSTQGHGAMRREVGGIFGPRTRRQDEWHDGQDDI